MNEKINIHTKEGTNVIEILHGEAKKIDYANSISVTGDIKAPADFLDRRIDVMDNNEILVEIHDKERVIDMKYRQQFNDSIHISGRVFIFPDLLAFKINKKEGTFSKDAFISLIRFSRRYFVETDKASLILEELKKFSIEINKTFEDVNDQRGNKRLVAEQVVSNLSLPVFFRLNIPLFQGFDYIGFEVELFYDTTDGGDIVFWMESVELKELLDTESQLILEKQEKRLTDHNIAVIHV